jgi:hypothetical protein
MNQVVEAYLRAFINFEQDNWVELLPATQLTYNTSCNKTIKTTPFFTHFGYKMDLRQGPESKVPQAVVRVERCIPIHEKLKDELNFIHNRMERYYDECRVEGPPLEEGDKVYLLCRNLKIR